MDLWEKCILMIFFFLFTVTNDLKLGHIETTNKQKIIILPKASVNLIMDQLPTDSSYIVQ